MATRILLAAGLAAALLIPGVALARAPEPRKPLDLDRFMGRWHEILRTPNDAQKNCFAAFQTWTRVEQGRFSIVQVCHRNAPDGPQKTVKTPARLIDPASTAKFEASFFGGLFKRQYWVLDRADDYGWMIASTSDGKFVSLLAREPALPPAEVARLRGRIAAMGLDAGRLEPSGRAAR